MAWANGGPGSKIPAAVKRTVRDRDVVCQLAFDCCTRSINEFDHIDGIAETRADRATAIHPDQLQGVCTPCHKVKTQGQAQAARNRWRRAPAKHIGLGL